MALAATRHPDGDADPDGEGDGDGAVDPVGDGDAGPDSEGAGDSEADPDGDAAPDGEADPDADAEGDQDGEGDPEGDSVPEAASPDVVAVRCDAGSGARPGVRFPMIAGSPRQAGPSATGVLPAPPAPELPAGTSLVLARCQAPSGSR
ncbi:MAG: hypothetical protein ACRDNF_25935 [Streptosporangiaceae bacterium]